MQFMTSSTLRRQNNNESPDRTNVNLLSIVVFVFVMDLFAFEEIAALTWIPLACTIFILWIVSKRRRVAIPRIYLLPYGFYAFTLLSTLWAAYPDNSFVASLRVLTAIATTQAIGIALLNGASLKALINGILFGACIAAASAVPEILAAGIGHRAGGIVGNANGLAWNLYIPAFVLFIFPEHCSPRHWVLASCLVIFSVVFTGSQKAVIAVAFLMMLVSLHVLFRPRNAVRTAVFFTLALIAVIAISGMGNLDNAIQVVPAISRVNDTLSGNGDSSVQKRDALITMGLKLWAKKPVCGYGINQFTHLNTIDDLYAHNNYVELLVGCGIIGMTLFYVFHILLIVNAMRISRRNWMRACSYLIILFLILIMDYRLVNYYTKSYWLLLSLLANAVCTTSVKITSGGSMSNHPHIPEITEGRERSEYGLV